MEVRGWPKIIALVAASAFGGALAFAACLVAFFSYFSVHGTSMDFSERNSETVHGAPPILERKRFLGTQGAYNSEFNPLNSEKVLDRGPGEIVGSITAGGKPVAGVRIKLALNGSVMSQPAKTGSDGKYHVPVPYGAYRIDGYSLEGENLDDLLGGKTDNPKSKSAQLEPRPIAVAEGKPGAGLDLDYIDTVRVTGPSGDVSKRKPIVVSWNAYPGAATYRIQLLESKGPGPMQSRRTVFGWRDRPEALGTSLDLTTSNTDLNVGSYYHVYVEALDQSMAVIATTGTDSMATEFHVVE